MLKQALVKLYECLQIYDSQRNEKAGLVDSAVSQQLHTAYSRLLEQMDKHSILNNKNND